MKKIRFNTIGSMVVVVLILFAIPVIAFATSVPWTTQEYSVTAWAGECCPWDGTGESHTVTGPPLPVSADAYYKPLFFPSYSSSHADMTSSSINLNAYSSGRAARGQSWGFFNGTFIANNPYFIFSYDHIGALETFDLSVVDRTTSTTLFYSGELDEKSHDKITILIPDGHEIGVNYSFKIWVAAGQDYPRSTRAKIYYDMAVALNPIPDVSGCIYLGNTLLVDRYNKVILKQPGELTKYTITDNSGCYEFLDAVSGKAFTVQINGPKLKSPVPEIHGCADLQGSPMPDRKVILKQIGEDNKTTKTGTDGCYTFTNAVADKNFKVLIKGPVMP